MHTENRHSMPAVPTASRQAGKPSTTRTERIPNKPRDVDQTTTPNTQHTDGRTTSLLTADSAICDAKAADTPAADTPTTVEQPNSCGSGSGSGSGSGTNKSPLRLLECSMFDVRCNAIYGIPTWVE